MRFGVIRLDGEGLVVAGHGIVQFPQVLERKAQVAVRFGKIGLDGEGFCNEIDSDVILTG